MQDMNLDEELRTLFKRTASGIKPGLETIAGILECLDNPQDAFVTIHIAGTNGKGSVAAMLESILRQAGFKTGLYTSPHLVDFRERIKIGGDPVSGELLGEVLEKVEDCDRDQVAVGAREATFFEMATAMGFLCFQRAGVQIAVIETGMGGKWDATNVVDSELSIITPISREHEKYLGSDIRKIASEKAGIIKAGQTVVLSEQMGEVEEVISRTAEERKARIKRVSDAVSVKRLETSLEGQKLKIETQNCAYPPILCPLLGDYQIGNVALAVLAAETLFAGLGLPLPPDLIRDGVQGVSWIGRGQVVGCDPIVILDGAHNPAAARNLARLLKGLAEGRRLGLIIGLLSDKDVEEFIRPFSGWLDHCWIVEIDNPRAMSAADMGNAIDKYARHTRVCRLKDAYREALDWAKAEDGVVCITGSLYLIGEFMQL